MSITKATFAGSQALTTAFATVAMVVPNSAIGPIHLGALWIFVNTISSATALTVRITRDLAGDEAVCPDFEADLTAGKTTAADGTAIIDYDRIPFFGATALYLHVKTDAGTATMTEANLTLTTN
jgi:hypothetical protein